MQRLRSLFALTVVMTVTITTAIGIPALAQTESRPIKKIALLQCPEPERFGARTNVQQGGAIWLLVYPDQSEKVTAALARDPVNLGAALTDAVEARLRAEGYEVVRMTAPREEARKLLKSYAGVQTDADAILDMTIAGAGYFRPTGLLAFRPSVGVLTRLVATEGRRNISSDHFTYDLFRNPDAPEYEQYKIEEIDDLVANPGRAKEGLLAGAGPLAVEVVAKVNEKNRPFDATMAISREGPNEPDAPRSDDRGSN